MYYIKTQGPNHGNPMGQSFPGCVALPDELLSAYLDTKGFCSLTMQDNTVTALAVDQEALDAYNAEHPEVEPEKPVTLEELLAALLGEEVNKNG